MTRLYLPPSSAATGISPSPAAEWDITAGLTRVIPSTTRTSTAFANKTMTADTTGSPSNTDIVLVQFVFPLPTGVAFTTAHTIKGRVLTDQRATGTNLRSQCIVRVIDNDGSTVEATLYAGDLTTGTGNPTSEWSTATTSRQMPRGSTVAVEANYTTPDATKYLIIEIGARIHADTTASANSFIRLGDNNATELPEDETDTADKTTWIEFSTNLAGGAVASRRRSIMMVN
jgi:hypothetical protein